MLLANTALIAVVLGLFAQPLKLLGAFSARHRKDLQDREIHCALLTARMSSSNFNCTAGKYPDQNDQHSPDKSPRAAENERGLAGEDAKSLFDHRKKVSLGDVFA